MLRLRVQERRIRQRPLCVLAAMMIFGLLLYILKQSNFVVLVGGIKPKTSSSSSPPVADGDFLFDKERHYFNDAEASVVQLVQEYIRQHGTEALGLNEYYQTQHMSKPTILSESDRRQFAIGVYSCPYQAGNRLTHFLNSLAFSLVTNRTLLWHYCDANFCPMHGTVDDCEKVLHRATWIPSLDDALVGYYEPLELPVRAFAVNHPKRTEILGSAVPLDAMPQQVVYFGIMEGLVAPVLATTDAQAVLSPRAHTIARRLFSAGTHFAYGALFHAAFEMQPAVVPSHFERFGEQQQSESSISIAIHSRHRKRDDSGDDTTVEESCLEQALSAVERARIDESSSSNSNNVSHPAKQHACWVAIMADRNATLQRLDKRIEELGCKSVIATHQSGESFSSEHGAFAGVGLFQGELSYVFFVLCCASGALSSGVDTAYFKPGRSSHTLLSIILLLQTLHWHNMPAMRSSKRAEARHRIYWRHSCPFVERPLVVHLSSRASWIGPNAHANAATKTNPRSFSAAE